MSPAKKYFSGKSLEQAVLEAAKHFELDPAEVSYSEVDRKHGFMKVRRRVVISVDPTAPRNADAGGAGESVGEARQDSIETEAMPLSMIEEIRGEAEGSSLSERSEDATEEATQDGPGPEVEDAPAETPRDERAPSEMETMDIPTSPAAGGAAEVAGEVKPGARDISKSASGDRAAEGSALAADDAREAAEESLRRLLKLGELDLEFSVQGDGEGLEVELTGRDESQLFEDRGRLLMAIEHLLPRMVRGLTGESVPCKVDSDNFHEIRAEQLRVMAQDAAAEARRERRPQTLDPMSPDERRIIHLTLSDDQAVETESHGSGLFKRVTVRPIRRLSKSFDPYSR